MIDAERAKKNLPPEALAGADAYDNYADRQVRHITTAGQMGLGEWRDDHIDLRQVVLA
jgi:hypothetical protein